MLYLLCGRKKLNTASFVYLRIQAIFQLLFFLLPFPLSILCEFDTHGDSWLSANFLPAFFSTSHMIIGTICCCFVCRLQLIMSYLRRSRTWNSYAWIAWRKVCWVVPITVAISASLCFEFHVESHRCTSPDGRRMKLVGVARPSEFGRTSSVKIGIIKALPTIIYWLTLLCLLIYFLYELRLRPRAGSPITKKHLPFLSNIRPFLIALIIALSIVHIPSTIAYARRDDLNQKFKLLLYASSYASPPFLTLAISGALREHFRMTVNHYLAERSQEHSDPQLTSVYTSRRLLSEAPTCSRLETENSEVDDRHFGGRRSTVREALHADAVHRVRFAMPTSLPSVIVEEDENDECADTDAKQPRNDGDEII
ncbi:hypothetical protein Tcan_06908 [Toxocara canis]|uniref:G_PROTEIN_RECEP_F1_2 domain-containing protein n=1 Tax=Toxocara canis TaxID=6265 RepID=A0A0B2V433_TOXCA|nr:hypothetical protein Tcan_06908 [Toxocara canis]